MSGWCQPMNCGKHTPRVWLIRFEDAEMGDLTFDKEKEAREIWVKLNDNWNTYLMASLPLEAPALSEAKQLPEVQALVEAAELLFIPANTLRVCTTTGGPNHEGHQWVHKLDYDDLRKRADTVLAALAAFREVEDG